MHLKIGNGCQAIRETGRQLQAFGSLYVAGKDIAGGRLIIYDNTGLDGCGWHRWLRKAILNRKKEVLPQQPKKFTPSPLKNFLELLQPYSCLFGVLTNCTLGGLGPPHPRMAFCCSTLSVMKLFAVLTFLIVYKFKGLNYFPA